MGKQYLSHLLESVNDKLAFDPNPDDNIDPVEVTKNKLEYLKDNLEEILNHKDPKDVLMVKEN